MTEKIKESLSVQFISIIAAYCGYNVQKPYADYGVDLMVEELSSYNLNDKIRYFSSGVTLDIQLKSTTLSNVSVANKNLKFDLESKNFNDLIKRHPLKNKSRSYYIPLILIIFVLPEHPSEWLNLSLQQLIIKGQAFWYYPDEQESLTLNRHSKRISIPMHQQVDLNFFPNFFKLLNQ